MGDMKSVKCRYVRYTFIVDHLKTHHNMIWRRMPYFLQFSFKKEKLHVARQNRWTIFFFTSSLKVQPAASTSLKKIRYYSYKLFIVKLTCTEVWNEVLGWTRDDKRSKILQIFHFDPVKLYWVSVSKKCSSSSLRKVLLRAKQIQGKYRCVRVWTEYCLAGMLSRFDDVLKELQFKWIA